MDVKIYTYNPAPEIEIPTITASAEPPHYLVENEDGEAIAGVIREVLFGVESLTHAVLMDMIVVSMDIMW